MIDLFARALINPIDYSGALRTHTLTLIEKRELIPHCWTFAFTSNLPLRWHAGQHAIFTLPGSKLTGKTWRAFSVASSPHEGVVRIATNIGDPHSDFKDHLLKREPGHTITMHGPFGEFHASGKAQHIIGLAGGIGITPFRSLAYDVAHGHLPQTRLSLIYSAVADYAFRDELDAWAVESSNLELIYTHTPEEVNQALATQFGQCANNADYYISGSPGMISALRTNCKNMGVKKIVNDPFKGY